MSVSSRLHWTHALVCALVFTATGSSAEAETRSLSFLNTHTQERATIVFKRNGQFDPEGLQELNRMLRDWRRNESTKMDPQLFDLVWEVYRDSGSSQPIHIVSGYRSPATNNALRSRSRGVAKFSQHMLGRAMDFFLPDVPLDRLRAIGMKKQVGGVGFYPTSGSPFVHMDTGSVRAWPRMSREQLARLFPDGKTAHLPADGAPLPRYEEALAEVQARKGRGEVSVASSSSGGGKSLFAAFFGGGSSAPAATDDDDEEAPRTVAPRPQELRQGPPPPGSRTLVAAAPAEEPGEKFVPPPPPAPKGPVVAALQPAPAQPAPAAQAAPGSLVALPVPAPAPRAPGSLVAPAPAAAAVAAPSGNGLPAGWVQGPEGKPVPTTPAAASAAVAAALPMPAAKPGANTVAAATAQPDPAFAVPRGKPAPVGASAPAHEAIAALTGTPADRVAANALGYAPSAPTPKPPIPEGSTVSRPAGSGIVVAALPPQAATTLSDGARLPAAAAATTARPAPKGDRTDPLAKLVSRPGETATARMIDATGSTRMAGFALLSHPDTERLPQLLAKPTQLVLSGFEGGGAELRADRFSGPAVVALTVMRTD